MKSAPPRRRLWRFTFFAAVLSIAMQPVRTQAASSSWRDVSVDEYRKHLVDLDQLLEACQKQRTARICDSGKVSWDDRVKWPADGASSQREVRYDWLRFVLDQAAGKNPNQIEIGIGTHAAKSQPVDLGALLAAARGRLSDDWKQAGGLTEAAPNHTAEQKSLTAILARPEYRGVSEVSAKQRFLEWLENVLEDILGRLVRFGSRSPWIAFALRALLLVALCVALVWALVRIERRSRIKLAPKPPVAGSPAAREWQLWLADARAMAERGLWREAIHFLYWASISRLESKRLWPADRARTPREYLKLLSVADPRKLVLTSLTRSFERTWYGGREAHDSDFDAALKLAADLGVE
ncbi:MAG TPA: DUF4129 domain-containing protein [Terracidiphilus sp.]|nr:DUF4129 domain-containing protein [Terracidiphilus sp.]